MKSYFSIKNIWKILLISILAIISYFSIVYFYKNKQEELTLNMAKIAMNIAQNSVERLGSISVKDDSLFAGENLLNGANKLVDHVKKETDFGCTIFKNDIRIATNAVAENSNVRAIGTSANTTVKKLVLIEGKTFSGVTHTLGKEWIIIYEPLKTVNNEKVGMLAVFQEMDYFSSGLNGFKLVLALVIGIFTLITMILIVFADIKNDMNFKTKQKLKRKNIVLEAQKKELEKLSIVADEMEQSVAIIGANDKILWVNKAFELNSGWDVNEAYGKICSDLIAGPKTDKNTIEKINEAIFIKKESIDCEVVHYRRDGSSYWVRIYLSPILNDKGELDKYVALSLNISEERRRRQLLRQSEANFRTITENLSDIFYLYNCADKKYEYISPDSENVLGASPAFFLSGKNYTELYVMPEDRKIVLDTYSSIARGTSYDVEYRIIYNNEVKWINERAFPIFDKNGVVIKNSGICRDVTRTKIVEDQLNESQRYTNILASIGSEILEELSVIEIIKRVNNRIKGVMDAYTFTVGIVDEAEGEVSFPLIIEGVKHYKSFSHKLNETMLANICINNDREIFTNDLTKDIKNFTNETLYPINGLKTNSIIYLPIKLKEKIIGALTVQSLSKDAYNANQLAFLRNLCVYIATALKNAKSYENMEYLVRERAQEVFIQKEQLEKNFQENQLLTEIGQQISSSLKFQEIFENLYNNINEMMDAAYFGVRLLDKNNDTVHYSFGIENGKVVDKISIPLTDKNNYTVVCIEQGIDIFINDNSKEYLNYVSEKKSPNGKHTQSLIFCPMIAEGNIIGVISAQSFKKNAYSKRDLQILKNLSNYTGIALNNARIYESMETLIEDRTIELREKTKEIISSINYTKNLQEATLTSNQERIHLFPDSYVIYKPKDIVSGDFFRVDTVHSKTGSTMKTFVVADCTGHGVPGASLAMLCTSIIKQTFSNDEINSPGEALNYARAQLKIFLRSNSSTVYDGMDLGFCVIDEKNMILHFAGGFSDCYILRNGKETVLKGNRFHVGYTDDKNQDFTTHIFKLKKGDSIYLTTDGILDQFGGGKTKKFGRLRMLDILKSNAHKPLEVQGKILSQALYEWQGDNEQTDDICSVGIRI